MIIEDVIEKYYPLYIFMCFNIGKTKCYVRNKYDVNRYQYINLCDIIDLLASDYIYRNQNEYYKYIRYKKLLKLEILNNY